MNLTLVLLSTIYNTLPNSHQDREAWTRTCDSQLIPSDLSTLTCQALNKFLLVT